ncbi:BTB/POZ domain-containing protein KCTD7 isoform X2 [Aplysia californica]|uniref:BTB/POZ domain-containing protein KCTD7 isoform X2 n=1 Tax=Aplysia californica TaxID=6500 RepID=A0ABM0JEY4_APLCA|nr:BTB/POZ domain-containing protein KCTD7 isoform X2 [Aplysia californica]
MDGDAKFPPVLELNVGGVYYTTSLSTLVKSQDHMLSAMFSGRHLVAKDKDGRYFIDADGTLFSHILRYLRSGDLPCSSMAPQVYKEAKYFGLEELQQHIEQMPVMMGKQARLQFQSRLAGFDEAIEQILATANKKQCIVSDEIVSFAVIAIHKDSQLVMNPAFDNDHRCFVNYPQDLNSADVVIGPWESDIEDVTDRVYLRAIARELESRGFTITFSKQGSCSYGIRNPDRIDCKKTVFKFIFHWHKFQ